MKMKKLFAGLVATTIVAAGTSAFAAPVANDAGFNKEAGTYSIVSDLSGYGSDQMTILIIPEAAYNAGTINDADILYIDQAAADTENIFANVGILGGTELADGTYYAKIGGENIAESGIIVEKFTVTTTPEGPTYTLGDVNNDGDILLNDATTVLQKVANIAELTETQMLAADVTKDGDVLLNDATTILQKIANIIENF